MSRVVTVVLTVAGLVAILCPAASAQHAENTLCGFNDCEPSSAEKESIEICIADAADAQACIGIVADPCTGADSTYPGMTACAQREEAVWDAYLNRYYDDLSEKLPESQKSLRAAQRAWLAWRDKECEFVRTGLYGGREAGIHQSFCRLRMTAERALSFRNWIGEFDR